MQYYENNKGNAAMINLYGFFKYVLGPPSRVIFPQKFINRENIPKEGTYLVCCNHISYLDPFFLVVGHKRQICFMAKDELFHNKIIAWLLYRVGAFPVKRGSGDTDSIKHALNLLENGRLLGIFPEGTRGKGGELLKFKAGAAMLAYKTQFPILPASIYAPKGVGPFKKHIINFGKLITLEELGLKEGTTTEIRGASRLLMERVAALIEESKCQS